MPRCDNLRISCRLPLTSYSPKRTPTSLIGEDRTTWVQSNRIAFARNANGVRQMRNEPLHNILNISTEKNSEMEQVHRETNRNVDPTRDFWFHPWKHTFRLSLCRFVCFWACLGQCPWFSSRHCPHLPCHHTFCWRWIHEEQSRRGSIMDNTYYFWHVKQGLRWWTPALEYTWMHYGLVESLTTHRIKTWIDILQRARREAKPSRALFQHRSGCGRRKILPFV